MAKNDQAIADIRKRIADVAADMTEIREDMENLKGDREVLGKGESDLKRSFFARTRNSTILRTNMINCLPALRPWRISLRLGVAPVKLRRVKRSLATIQKVPRLVRRKRNWLMSRLMMPLRKKSMRRLEKDFKTYLKKYPNTEYSDSAQFWIGECYYFERKYEQAILEYEKVIKNYPQGNKVPNAMLKQGFAFLNLGDKSSAKLLLEQVAKNYPGSNQARMARAKLAEIK